MGITGIVICPIVFSSRATPDLISAAPGACRNQSWKSQLHFEYGYGLKHLNTALIVLNPKKNTLSQILRSWGLVSAGSILVSLFTFGWNWIRAKCKKKKTSRKGAALGTKNKIQKVKSNKPRSANTNKTKTKNNSSTKYNQKQSSNQ